MEAEQRDAASGGGVLRGRLHAAAAVLTCLFLFLGVALWTSSLRNFRETLSESTGPGMTWPIQSFYNFCFGRPYQNSVFATDSEGPWCGFRHNPFAFMHANVVHVNVTPYALAPFWALRPTPGFYQVLLLLYNLLGTGLCTWWILRRLLPHRAGAASLLVFSIFLAGGSLFILSQKGQFLLFAGPLMMAVYAAALHGRSALFVAAVLSLCLVQEDAAMVAAGLSLYLVLMEPKLRRFGWLGLMVSVPLVGLLIFVVQPVSRIGLDVMAGTTTVAYAHHLLTAGWIGIRQYAPGFLPMLPLAAAFLVVVGLFGMPSRPAILRAVGLCVLPVLPHLGVSLTLGAGHHLLPPFVATYLAMLLLVGDAGGGKLVPNSPRRLFVVTAAGAVFLMLAVRVHVSHFQPDIRLAIYRWTGREAHMRALELARERACFSNPAVISAARAIPPEGSLVYWVNNNVTGFIADRTALWHFPDYYDRADFLLIQKDAEDLFYAFQPGLGGLDEALSRTGKTNLVRQPMTPEMLSAVREELVVRRKTHGVQLENDHVLMLERVVKESFESPEWTRGWGWLCCFDRRKAVVRPAGSKGR